MKKGFNQLELARDSLRNIGSRRFIREAAFDALGMLCIFLIASFASAIVNMASGPSLPIIAQMYELRSSGQEEAFEEAALQFKPEIERLAAITLAAGVCSYLLMVFASSMAGSRAWKIRHAWAGYFYLNLMWSMMWILLILVAILVLPPSAAAVALLAFAIIYLFTDPMLRAKFEMSMSIRKSFNFVATNFYRPHMVYLLAVVISTLLLLAIIPYIQIAIWQLAVLILGLAAIIGWSREYMRIFVVRS